MCRIFFCACFYRPPGALRVAVLGALRSPAARGFQMPRSPPGGGVAKSPPNRCIGPGAVDAHVQMDAVGVCCKAERMLQERAPHSVYLCRFTAPPLAVDLPSFSNAHVCFWLPWSAD
jgi:hypothetical protein